MENNALTPEQLKQKIIAITEVFGMKAEVAARAMGITAVRFRKNMSEKTLYSDFTPQNLEDLKAYILQKAQEIQQI